MTLALRAALVALALFCAGGAGAQDITPLPGAQPQPAPAADTAPASAAARPEDVKSMDAIIAALYEVISGDAGAQRDWDRFRTLFHPGARMIPTGRNAKTGKVGARLASPEEYIKANEGFLEGQGFHEQELGRHVDTYGTIAQVFSAYEARHKLTDDKPFLRGINSIQLLNDGNRWWVLTLAWAPETPENPLPERFTRKAER